MAAMVIVLMGVSGTGKTAVGTRLARALGGTFAEGDDYHPPANVAKMRSGTPLDDADRKPWLETLSREIGRWLDEGQTVVLACSALKQSYRDILKASRPDVVFVHLKGDPALIRTGSHSGRAFRKLLGCRRLLGAGLGGLDL